jgi:NTE family protein
VQERLINWGYAVCDAAMRRHVDASLSAPDNFPYQRGV